jgi:hypothetical protein
MLKTGAGTARWSSSGAPASSSATTWVHLAKMVPGLERCPVGCSGTPKVRFTAAGEPATDFARALPDHRCVMTDAWRGTLPGVIFHLFFNPQLGRFRRPSDS